MNSNIIFRQLFDEKSWTYTYILADSETQEALIIDPVRDQIDRDLKLIAEFGITLTHILDTHIHADHITGSGLLRQKTGAKIAMGEGAHIAKPDILLADGEIFTVGDIRVKAISTPGHTDVCTSYFIGDMLFTGDTLLIRKTGRTDFQGGSAERLYDSIQSKIYTLPDTAQIYPGHDYTGQTMSTVGEEKSYNTRIKDTTTLVEFVETMQAVNLDYPKYIDIALPANMQLGIYDNQK
ncbi:MBL fold metallo-hydrolase [Candidatus Gracilibacteria bacterium]|nr:MBL fold metallo-hydrolase [Candidatus Gracilibacteria bacterium]